jgi:hypothetical protein
VDRISPERSTFTDPQPGDRRRARQPPVSPGDSDDGSDPDRYSDSDSDSDSYSYSDRRMTTPAAVPATETLPLNVFFVLDRIWDQIIVSTRASLTAPARPGLVDDEHRRLIEAIRDGDPQGAAAHAREHILATMSVLTEQGEVT